MAGDAQNIEETQRRTRYRQLNWTVHVNLAKQYFEDTVRKANSEGYFELLYVAQDEGQRQIQLFAGAHPVGTLQVVWDTHDRLKRQRLYVEKGAALVMSQSIRGDVAVFLYPYQSEKHSRKEKYIVCGVFDDPAKVTELALRQMTKDFFTYIRVSSLRFMPSFSENLRISWLLLLSHRYDEQGLLKFILTHSLLLAVGVLGSIASIWGLALALK